MFLSNKKNPLELNIKINNEPLKKCDSYKYLGVMFDCNLTWKPHVDNLCGKISKACGALSKIRHCVNIETLTNVYYALVHSYLRYGITAWGNAAENVLKPLHALLNRVVRIMTFAPFGINTKPILEFLEILSISQIFSLETGKFVFKSRNSILPISTIANHFERTNANHNYNLRNRTNQYVTPLELLSSFKKKSLHIRGAHLWNNVPESIKSSDSFSIFLKCFKSFLQLEQNE